VAGYVGGGFCGGCSVVMWCLIVILCLLIVIKKIRVPKILGVFSICVDLVNKNLLIERFRS
jgi:hypothetical protein